LFTLRFLRVKLVSFYNRNDNSLLTEMRQNHLTEFRTCRKWWKF